MREESGKECPDFGKRIIFSWWEDNYISQYKKKGVNEISELWLESFEEFEEYEWCQRHVEK